MKWNVIYYDINSKKIETYNIFRHGGFRADVNKFLNTYDNKDEFAENLKSSLMYFFWSKSEWEILISPWLSAKTDKEVKVDVCWQVMNNWEVFVDYVWSHRDINKRRSHDR